MNDIGPNLGRSQAICNHYGNQLTVDIKSAPVLFEIWIVYTISDMFRFYSLQWRHNEPHGVSNHRRLGCLLNLLFRRRSNKTSKLRVTGLYEGNSPVTGEFPTQRNSDAENVSIWWRHHVSRADILRSSFFSLARVEFNQELCNTHTVCVSLYIFVNTLNIIDASHSISLRNIPRDGCVVLFCVDGL